MPEIHLQTLQRAQTKPPWLGLHILPAIFIVCKKPIVQRFNVHNENIIQRYTPVNILSWAHRAAVLYILEGT